MNKIRAKDEEIRKIKEYEKNIDSTIEDLNILIKNPLLLREIKDKREFLSLEDQNKIYRDSIRYLEEVIFSISFEESGNVDLFRNLDKQVCEIYENQKVSFKEEIFIRKLVKHRNNGDSLIDKRFVNVKSKNKSINYEFYDKLSGFLAKKGCFVWNDEKIDEFFNSVMK